MIRVALSLNTCWLVLHIFRLYTRAGEGHFTNRFTYSTYGLAIKYAAIFQGQNCR